MIIDYQSGPRKFKLTPKRIRLVKHSLRRSLMATAKDQIADQKASDALLNTLQPEVGREIKAMIGAGNDSVLQTSDKNLSSFSWKTLEQELTSRAPMLIRIVKSLLGQPDQNQIQLCFN